MFDATAQVWLEGAFVELTILDGSSPPQSDISDRRGAVTFSLTAPSGTPVQLDLSKAGYCPVTVTMALPEKRGKGLAQQFAMTQCVPEELIGGGPSLSFPPLIEPSLSSFR